MERRHAIIIIKNKDGQYLQIFQDTWSSYLFLNCKIEDENDIYSINRCIKETLDAEPISIEYKFDKIHTKFSEKDKINKEYHHYFFIIDIDLASSLGEFEKNGNHFRWFSYEELLNDKRIQQVNGDIVGFIKDISL